MIPDFPQELIHVGRGVDLVAEWTVSRQLRPFQSGAHRAGISFGL
jgi:hypothetical protein